MSMAYDRETDVRDASDSPLIVGLIVSCIVHFLLFVLVPAWTPNLGVDIYSLDEGGIIQLEALRPSTGVGEKPSTSGLPSGRPETVVNPGKPGTESLGQEKSQNQVVQVEQGPAEPESGPKGTVQIAEVKPQAGPVKVQDSDRPASKPVEAGQVEVKQAEPKPAAAHSSESKASGTDKAGVTGVLTSQAGTVEVKAQSQPGSSPASASEPPAVKPPAETPREASNENAPASAPKASEASGAGASTGVSGSEGGKESVATATGGGSSPVAGDTPQQGMSGMSMVLSTHKPSYPKNAQNARAKGQVKVLIRVSPDGAPVSVTVVESTGDTSFGFDSYVVKTIEKGWRFKSASSEYEFELTFKFDLDAATPVKIEDGDVRFITQR